MTASEFPPKPEEKTTTWLVAVSLVFFALSWLAFLFQLGIILPLIIVGLIDLYIWFLLFLCARLSDGKTHESSKKSFVPWRWQGLLLFFIFLFTVILSFAACYHLSGNYFDPEVQTRFESFYVSFLSLTTLGFANIEQSATQLKSIMIFEVFTGISLFLGAFALLLSRITNF